MNEDILKGKWEQLKGTIQKKWGELTNDEVNKIAGDSKKLSGLIQERYGHSKEDAEKEINEWLKK
ncbi:MAG: CsbD family protein [Rickettsiales bacterium]|nr:MAG: CsbD family protein [Rickettsiales bacterium]